MEDKKERENFKIWFTRKWLKWDDERGARSTQNELADYLGVSRPAISKYIQGDRLPDKESLRKIARKFGNEVYSVAGIGIPEDLLPPEFSALLQSMLVEIANTLAATNTDLSSEEAERVAREIASKSGLISTDTE